MQDSLRIGNVKQKVGGFYREWEFRRLYFIAKDAGNFYHDSLP